jgi:BASS family bile acid:Na+ symporter
VPNIRNILLVITKHATALLFLSIFVGLNFPALPPIFSPFLAPLVWLLLFLSLVHDEWKGTINFLKRPGLVICVGVWLFLVSPGIVWLAGQGLALEGGILSVMVLWAASPPLMGSPALSRFTGLDAPLSLGVLMVMTVAAPLVMPVVVITLLGLDLKIGMGEMLFRLAAFVGSALVSALIARRLMVKRTGYWVAPVVDFSLLAVLVFFAIGIMDGVANRFSDNPLHVLQGAGNRRRIDFQPTNRRHDNVHFPWAIAGIDGRAFKRHEKHGYPAGRVAIRHKS